MKRREFLKVSAAAAGTGALLATGAKSALARENEPRNPEGLGLLYDSTLCIGCKACVAACKEANQMPPEFTAPGQLWDSPVDLSAKTLNIIKLYKTGSATKKDSSNAEDSFSFIKRQCMHCVDPSCVSACPATALTKDPATGVVKYNENNCIGCRYCMVACPFGIPKFEWEKALPKIRKCELCNHRTKDGHFAACAEACPTGATLYGKTSELLEEAKKRVQLRRGEKHDYPVSQLKTKYWHEKPVTPYNPRIYGEKEGGGTQCLILTASNVAAEKLGLPELPERSWASVSETVQHTIYKGFIAPGILLAGLGVAAWRSTKEQEKNGGGEK